MQDKTPYHAFELLPRAFLATGQQGEVRENKYGADAPLRHVSTIRADASNGLVFDLPDPLYCYMDLEPT